MKLLSDRILIEIDKAETTTNSGLVVPKHGDHGDPRTGKVVATGEGKRNEEGGLLPMTVKEGDQIIFQYGNDISVEGKPYILVREEDVVMILG